MMSVLAHQLPALLISTFLPVVLDARVHLFQCDVDHDQILENEDGNVIGAALTVAGWDGFEWLQRIWLELVLEVVRLYHDDPQVDAHAQVRHVDEQHVEEGVHLLVGQQHPARCLPIAQTKKCERGQHEVDARERQHHDLNPQVQLPCVGLQ